MTENIMGEIYLEPQEQIITNAEEIAQASENTEKYVFCITYEAAEKAVVLSEIKRLECEILAQSDAKSIVTVRASMSQLAAIKALNCIEKVEIVEENQAVNNFETYSLKKTDESDIINTEALAVTAVAETAAMNNGIQLVCDDEECNNDCDPDCSNDQATAVQLSLNGWQSSEICCPGAEIWYKFTPSTTAYYTVYTSGSLDTVGYLYDSNCNQLDYDDDDGSGLNFKIVNRLIAGQTYYIKARAFGGNTGYFNIVVTNTVFVESVTIDDSCITLNKGEMVTLSATVLPSYATNKTLRWESSDTSVVTVNSSTGKITAVGAGFACVCAYSQDGSKKSGCCEVTVNVPVESTIPVQNITMCCDVCTLNVGKTTYLSYDIYPPDATNQSVTWYSSNSKVVSVDAKTGLVTAKAVGRAVIYAKALDGSGASGHCTFNVKQHNYTPAEDKCETKVAESTCADPVDVFSGAHTLKNTLITLFGGQGLNLVAHYDSTKLSRGVLGIGWYHNFEKRLEESECEVRVYNSPSSYLRYVCNDDCTEYTCTAPNKNGYILTVDCSQQYPYIINCNSEYTEYYDSEGYLVKVIDHQGFETLITHSDVLTTITDTVSGKNIYLEKDGTGKVVRVYDDALRQVTFTYDGDLLTAVCDPNGNSLSYTYNEDGQVLTGTDSKGTCYFTNTYDEFGRVSTQKDGVPGSKTSTFSYDGSKRITTDRNGNQSIRVFDSNGLLISYTDENGNVKTYSYDSRYNVIKETDANGNSVLKSYNSFNKPTVITDKNGNETYISYDDKGNIAKITYPAVDGVAPEEIFVYNSRNQMTQHTNLRGTVTVYSYDVSGMPESKKIGNKNAILYSYQNGLLKSQTDAKGSTVHYGHNALGQVVSMTDAADNVTLYEYDACGNLLKTTDANGKTVVNTYDCNHQKTSVTDANGNKTQYSYNGNMKNDIVTLPDNNTVRYEFDGEDRPVKETDQAGNETTTQYDKAGRVVSRHFADGGSVTYEYDKVGNVIKETNPKGAVTVKTYDAAGNVLSVVDNDGNITRYQYNAMGKTVRAINAVSGTVIYKYSPAGDLLSETDALGNKKVYTYDVFGNMLTTTDAKGNVTTHTYDANNNLLTVCDALGNTTTYTYNALNQLVSVTDAKNNTVTYGYDALGRRTTVTDARGNVFTTVYDGNGNVLKTLDAKGNTVSETVYNCLNKPASVVDATGKTTTYTYNALGKVATVTDSMNHRQEYSYNSRGQNTSVRDANNGISSAEYDVLGNITKLAGPLGGATHYTYDEMGRLIAETTSSGGTVSYGYNELNVKEQLTNARGQVRKYFHDAMGRIVGYVGAEDSVSYTYDQNGNVLTVTDKNGTVKREYDALNRVTKYTDTFGKSICYEYDAVGNLTELIYPDNTSVTYTYDANKNLVLVIDWANRVTTYTYDENNRMIGVTKPDGSVTTTVYDNKQRITSTVEKTASGTVITGFEYTYDTLSRIVEEKHLAENIKMCYTYDSLNRVTKRQIISLSCDCVVSEENYTYDAAGNITNAPDSCFQYDTNNRLITFNGNTVSYDMDGNMLSNGYINCEFDSGNRLISAGGHTYTYNAEDVRIRNLCADADTTYTYNTNCKLSQLLCKTTNGITTKYVYGIGLIGEEKEGCFKTYHFDYRGSTVAITDINGNITDTFEYDTYGRIISRTGDSFVIFGYNGRDGVITDKNGLYYMRARYYSPEMHRFINADIIAGSISNAVTLNRYAYANGNPVSFVDPIGLRGIDLRGTPVGMARRKKAFNDTIIPEDLPDDLKQKLRFKGFNQTYEKLYVNEDVEKYKDIILKALGITKEKLVNYFDNEDSLGSPEGIDVEYSALCGIISGAFDPSILNGTRLKVQINPNYNTSGDELVMELASFIPIFDVIYGIVDYASYEDASFSGLFGIGFSAVDNANDSFGSSKLIKNIGFIGKVLNAANVVETVENWNSSSKMATEIHISLCLKNGSGYYYKAVVDENLRFKEMASGAMLCVASNTGDFSITVKE